MINKDHSDRRNKMTDCKLPEDLTYEDAIKRLEEIVTTLERGEGSSTDRWNYSVKVSHCRLSALIS